ncbi:MAG: DUF423 domain-containing protein [Planctomycetia bacterium]
MPDPTPERSAKRWLATAAVMGGVGVALGAFGAHSLKDYLEPRMLEVFEIGVRYQMYHSLALAVAAVVGSQRPGVRRPALAVACWGFFAGTLVFSGSLYALAFSGVKVLGAVTPIGGVAYLVGWSALAVAALSIPKTDVSTV